MRLSFAASSTLTNVSFLFLHQEELCFQYRLFSSPLHPSYRLPNRLRLIRLVPQSRRDLLSFHSLPTASFYQPWFQSNPRYTRSLGLHGSQAPISPSQSTRRASQSTAARRDGSLSFRLSPLSHFHSPTSYCRRYHCYQRCLDRPSARLSQR